MSNERTVENMYNATKDNAAYTVYELDNGTCYIEDANTEEEIGLYDNLEKVKAAGYFVF